MEQEIKEGEPLAGLGGAGAPVKHFPGPIDWDKPVRTKGRKSLVTIYAIDKRLKKPVVGRVEDEFGDVGDWDLAGRFMSNSTPCGVDLENVPEPTSERPALPTPSSEEGSDPLLLALISEATAQAERQRARDGEEDSADRADLLERLVAALSKVPNHG